MTNLLLLLLIWTNLEADFHFFLKNTLDLMDYQIQY